MRNVMFSILAVSFVWSLAAASAPATDQVPLPLPPPAVDESCGPLVGSVFAGTEVPGQKASTNGLTSPTLVPGTKVSPTFSETALKAGGKVHLSAIVCKDGSVRAVEVVKTPAPDAGAAAAEAVQQWKFTPAVKNGTPVAVRYMVSVDVKP
jgi:TonB family protein